MANDFHNQAEQYKTLAAGFVAEEERLIFMIGAVQGFVPISIINYYQAMANDAHEEAANLIQLEQVQRVESIKFALRSSFTGVDIEFTGEGIEFDRLREIDTVIQSCETEQGTGLYDLGCLVALAHPENLDYLSEIEAALKNRLLDELKIIVGETIFDYQPNEDARINLKSYELWDGVPFVYDRESAADKATELAGRGFEQALTEYPFAGSGTDSARFMSIALHAGKLPFTTTDDTAQANICDTGIEGGWCVKAVGNFIEANPVFKSHNINATPNENDVVPIEVSELTQDTGLVGYLAGSATARGQGISSEGEGEVVVFSVEDLFGKPTEYDIVLDPGEEDLIPIAGQPLPSPSYTIFSNTNLSSRLTAIVSQLANFEVGDYVFTGGNGPHGFLITGWGNAVDCSTGSIVVPNVTVPYVADLPNLQVGTPRPFYCSRISDPQRGGAWFAHRWWYFVKMPDVMFIKFTRLFHPDPII